MKRITEITKRDILDLFRNGLEIDEFFDTQTVSYHYFGRIEDTKIFPFKQQSKSTRVICQAIKRAEKRH